VQLGESGDGAKPKRVSLPRGVDPGQVSLDYALRLLSLPRAVGVDPESGKTVTAGLGRFGPYVERGGRYKNLKSVDQVFSISLADALKALEATGSSVLKELGANPSGTGELRVMAGRYGPYVTDGTLNASLPRGIMPDAVSMDDAVNLLEARAARVAEEPNGAGGRRRVAKKATKKASKKKPKAKSKAKAKAKVGASAED
jgi:DNA topoisomerase-1